MSFRERMKETLENSMAASKELFTKASATAKGLSEKAVIHLEIKELEGRAKKEFSKLGHQVYAQFIHEGKASITAKNHEIVTILEEISHLETEIDKREMLLSSAKNEK